MMAIQFWRKMQTPKMTIGLRFTILDIHLPKGDEERRWEGVEEVRPKGKIKLFFIIDHIDLLLPKC